MVGISVIGHHEGAVGAVSSVRTPSQSHAARTRGVLNGEADSPKFGAVQHTKTLFFTADEGNARGRPAILRTRLRHGISSAPASHILHDSPIRVWSGYRAEYVRLTLFASSR